MISKQTFLDLVPGTLRFFNDGTDIFQGIGSINFVNEMALLSHFSFTFSFFISEGGIKLFKA